MRVQLGEDHFNLAMAYEIDIDDEAQAIEIFFADDTKYYEMSNEEWEITLFPKIVNYLNGK